MSTRKKAVSLLLCAALALSLAACGTRPETPAQPAASPATAAPETTSAPETTAAPDPAVENLSAPVVSVRRESETFYSDDNTTRLLIYACAEPGVTLHGNAASAAAINEALHEQYTDFSVGVEAGDEYSLSGKENYLADAKAFYAEYLAAGNAESFAPYALQRETSVRRADRHLPAGQKHRALGAVLLAHIGSDLRQAMND